MTFPFSLGKTRIDYLILRLETYPQDRGTRPSVTFVDDCMCRLLGSEERREHNSSGPGRHLRIQPGRSTPERTAMEHVTTPRGKGMLRQAFGKRDGFPQAAESVGTTHLGLQ
jgi:hypothetical protein